MGNIMDILNFALVLALVAAGALIGAVVVVLWQRRQRARLTDPKCDHFRHRYSRKRI